MQTLGVSAAAAPFIPYLESQGQASGPPLRILFFYETLGGWRDAKSGTGGETDFTLNEAVRSLEPLRDELLLLDGLDYACIDHVGASHNHHVLQKSVLTGKIQNVDEGELRAETGGPSVDQVIARRMGGETAFPSILLAMHYTSGFTRGLVSTGPGEGVSVERNIGRQFDGLFGGVSPMTAGPDLTTRNRGSVLDAVHGELDELIGRLGGADRRKIDAHLEAVRSLERRLAPSAAACAVPEIGSISDSRDRSDAVIDMAVAALSCDLTRVAVVQHAGDGVTWEVDEYHHPLTHDKTLRTVDQLVQTDAWYVSQYAKLCTRLQEIPEGDGTMLDNTICVWCQEETLGTHRPGGDTHDHVPYGVPWMIVGGRNAGLRLGRKLDFDGHPHNDLLITLCHLMGLNDVNQIGEPDLCNGGLRGLV